MPAAGINVTLTGHLTEKMCHIEHVILEELS
jgi:hypothetical protein